MLDLVYPLGSGSKWNNSELKYSLRSVEKHLKNFDKVFIVGQFPDFLNSEAIHITQPIVSGNAARNIAMNLLAACQDERLSQSFLYMTDDLFFTKDVDATTYPTYFKCDLEKTYRINVTDYRRHVRNTMDVLKEQGHKTLNFDVHYPTTFKKTELKRVIESNNFNRSFGLIIKSLYFNTLGTQGTLRDDCKVVQIKRLDQWREYVKTTECFSIADTCINQVFKDFMAETYPEKSRWEI
jgi:AAA15 family ATPase/GTPase